MKNRDLASLLLTTTAMGLVAALRPHMRKRTTIRPRRRRPPWHRRRLPEETELVATGSRIDRAGFDAPTPTTVLSGDALSGQSSEHRPGVERPPAIPVPPPRPSRISRARRRLAGFDLRGLGHDAHPDPTQRPPLYGLRRSQHRAQGLITRVEVVTGGASAAWARAQWAAWSHPARRKPSGLTVGAQTGIWSRGDASLVDSMRRSARSSPMARAI